MHPGCCCCATTPNTTHASPPAARRCHTLTHELELGASLAELDVSAHTATPHTVTSLLLLPLSTSSLQAHVRLVDALYATGAFAEAADALRRAVDADPGFRQIPEFKAIAQALRQQKQRVPA